MSWRCARQVRRLHSGIVRRMISRFRGVENITLHTTRLVHLRTNNQGIHSLLGGVNRLLVDALVFLSYDTSTSGSTVECAQSGGVCQARRRPNNTIHAGNNLVSVLVLNVQLNIRHASKAMRLHRHSLRTTNLHIQLESHIRNSLGGCHHVVVRIR